MAYILYDSSAHLVMCAQIVKKYTKGELDANY